MEGGREGGKNEEGSDQSINKIVASNLSFFLGRQCLKDVDETQALK